MGYMFCMKKLTLALLLLSNLVYSNELESVSQLLYKYKYSQLPQYKSKTIGQVLGMISGFNNRLRDRAETTFSDESETRPEQVKIFHPMGVCYKGSWSITENSEFKGLFKKNAQANLIARLSTGDEKVKYKKGKSRIFGMALKLFHSELDHSLNIQTLDQNGLQRSDRRNFLYDAKEEVFFTNKTKPFPGFFGKLVDRAFKYIDFDPNTRPIHHIAEAFNESTPIPSSIKFKPINAAQNIDTESIDFRDELLLKKEINFEIVIGDGAEEKQIGIVKLKNPIANKFCDLGLHFHHEGNRN